MVGLAWGDAVTGDGERYEELIRAAEGLATLSPQLRADAMEIRMQGLIRRARFAEAAALVADPEDPAVQALARFPDRAFGVLANAACALTCEGRDVEALAVVDRAIVATATVPGLVVKSRAARAQLLARLDRHDEADAVAREVQEWADRLDDPVQSATATHDRGLIALRAGRYVEAADLLARSLDAGAAVSRVSARLALAEALALAGRPRESAGQLRQAVLEPVGRADQAWALVPRVAWIQALVAVGEGDRELAGRRLEEAPASLAQPRRAAQPPKPRTATWRA